VPNRIWRGGKSHECLHDLAQPEHDHQTEEWPGGGSKDPFREKKDSQQIDDGGAHNQKCIGRAFVFKTLLRVRISEQRLQNLVSAFPTLRNSIELHASGACTSWWNSSVRYPALIT